MADKVAPTKRGRKPILDPELVAAAVSELSGNLSAVAKKFGVSRAAVQKLVRNQPDLGAVLSDAREGMKDNAESSLYRAVLAGEAWAVCFFLKCQAKDRGYVEKAPETLASDIAASLFKQMTEAHQKTEPTTPAEAKPDAGP